MDMSSTPSLRPAIEWPSPIVNNVASALEDAGCAIERLRALMASNISDMNEILISALDGDQQRRAADIWMIFVVAQEKLDEFDRLIAAITEAAHFERRTAIGRHVDLLRLGDWKSALGDYRLAVEASLAVTRGEVNDGTADVAGEVESNALQRMAATRVPDLKALLDKVTAIDSTDAWTTDHVVKGVIDDIAALAALNAEG